MTTREPTARPWMVARREGGKRGAGAGYDIYGNGFPIVIMTDGETNRANAALIVEAVNQHDALVEAAKETIVYCNLFDIHGPIRDKAEAALSGVKGA